MFSIQDIRAKYPGAESLSDEEIIGVAAERYGTTPDVFKQAIGYKPKTRNPFAVANDTAIEIANAAAGGLGAAADFVAPGNRFSKGVDEFVKSGETKQSDVVKADKAKFQADLSASQSIGDDLSAVGAQVLRSPLQVAGQAVGSFAGPGLAVKGMTTGARVLGATGRVAELAGRGAGIAAGAAMSGGDAAGNAYDLVMAIPEATLVKSPEVAAMLAQGIPLAQARETVAVKAAREASVLPAIIGGASGAFGAEKILAAGGMAKGGLRGVLGAGAVEGAGEALDEGASQYMGQRAAQQYDPSINPTKNVAAMAAMGGIMGAGTGFATGAAHGQIAEPGQTMPPPPSMLQLPAPVVSVDGAGTAQTTEQRNDGMQRFRDIIAARGGVVEKAPNITDIAGASSIDQAIEAATAVVDVPQLPGPINLPRLAAPAIQVSSSGEATTTEQRNAEIQQAVADKEARGGLIEVLPAQRSPQETAPTAMQLAMQRAQQQLVSDAVLKPTPTQEFSNGTADLPGRPIEPSRIERSLDAGPGVVADGRVPANAGQLNQANAGTPARSDAPTVAVPSGATNALSQPAMAAPSAQGITVEPRDSGSILLKGDPGAIRQQLNDARITSYVPVADGVVVGKSHAARAQQLFAPAVKEKVATPLKVGVAPGSAELVTVQDGVVHIGKYEAIDFDSGEPVRVAAGASEEQIREVLKSSGAISGRQRFYGGGAQVTASAAETTAQPIALPVEEVGKVGIANEAPQSVEEQVVVGALTPLPDNVIQGLFESNVQWDSPATTIESAMRSLGSNEEEINNEIAKEPRVTQENSQGGGIADEVTSGPAQASPASGADEKASPEGLTSPTKTDVIDQQQRAAQEEKATAELASKATAILNAANVTGKERIDVLKDAKQGAITPEELQAAYPAKEQPQKDKEAATPVRDAQPEEKPVLSRSSAVRDDGDAKRATVQSMADDIKSSWSNGPEVVVVRNMQDEAVPRAVREHDKSQQSVGAKGDVEGFFYGGKVYLLTDHIANPERAATVLFHEALGHYGLRGVFGESLTPILKQVATFRSSDIRTKAEAYSLDPSKESDRLIAAEEVLAEMAQATPEIGLVQRAIAAVRSWLRANIPGFANLKLTDAEIIRNYLMPARDWVKSGAVPGGPISSDSVGSMADDAAGQEAWLANQAKSNGYENIDQLAEQDYPLFKKLAEQWREEHPAEMLASRAKSKDQAETPEFKKWFGDSKVVDTDGKPLTVYHGTPSANIEIFDPSRIGANGRAEGAGFYFTTDRNTADGYAKGQQALEVHLSIKTPLDYNAKPFSQIQIRKLLAEVALTESAENGNQWQDGYLSNYADTYNKSIDASVREAAKSFAGEETALDQIGQIIASGVDPDIVNEAITKALGYDGYFSRGYSGEEKAGGDIWVAMRSEQIKSATGNNGEFNSSNPDIRFSRAPVPEWVANGGNALKSAASKIDTYAPAKPIKEKIKALSANWKDRLVQGMVDAYAPLKKLSPEAYIAARMVKSADGVLEGMLMYGKPKMSADGGISGQLDGQGFLGMMKKLNGEHDRFFMWLAGNRAARLATEGRENLFAPNEIVAMKALNLGKMKDGSARQDKYAEALKEFEAYNKSVLDIAEKTGLIDGESRSLWEHDFYVPFHRVNDDNTIAGPGKIKGLVRQKAFEKLKGGKENLGDLMENTLRNWSRMLSGSLANQAAAKSLIAAERVGVAIEAKGTDAAEMAKTMGKKGGAVYFMDQGKQRWFVVDDPFVLEAISAVEPVQMNGVAMKVMRAAKHWLTVGTTISLPFRVRNLMRDSLAAVAQNDMSFNVAKNLVEGWKGTNKGNDQYAQMLFGGALMRFGNYMDGEHASHVKTLIKNGVDDGTILNTKEKVKAATVKAWDAWQEFGDRMENVNRAALYKKLIADGKTHLEASYASRDMMDFSMGGSWQAVRILTQIIPFLNARAQGLYKLGRSAKEDPKRMGYVVGAVALASIALMMAYRDDDDWKQREDWDRDSFWWFKIGDTAYRIPKPFEIGALGTIAERSVELMTDDEMTGARFAGRMKQMVTETFLMNPVPQAFKPMLDLYANKDSFTGRDIETRGMERLSKSERFGPGTSDVAKLLGKAGDVTGISPAQIDHLVRAYFGWLGSNMVLVADSLVPNGPGEKPDWKAADFSGGFVKELSAAQSRYVTDFYDQAKKVSEVMADIKRARESGDLEKAAELVQDNKESIRTAGLFAQTERRISLVNTQIKRVQNSTHISAEQKQEDIDRLTAQRNRLAKMASLRARQAA